MPGSIELESLPRTLLVEGFQIPGKILLTRPAMQSIAIADRLAPARIGVLATNTARPWRGSTAGAAGVRRTSKRPWLAAAQSLPACITSIVRPAEGTPRHIDNAGPRPTTQIEWFRTNGRQAKSAQQKRGIGNRHAGKQGPSVVHSRTRTADTASEAALSFGRADPARSPPLLSAARLLARQRKPGHEWPGAMAGLHQPGGMPPIRRRRAGRRRPSDDGRHRRTGG